MHPAGLAAYEARDPKRQNRYSFENRNAALSAKDEKTFRANKKAWENFSAFPPSYRQPAIWWVVSAKKAETRERRLATLIEDSAAGRKIKPADARRRGKHERRKAVRLRVRLFGAGSCRADAAAACGDLGTTRDAEKLGEIEALGVVPLLFDGDAPAVTTRMQRRPL